jgi:hypothetical protein
MDKVLVESYDHSYRVSSVREKEVVWNTKLNEYYEWAGQDLEDDEKIVLMMVVQ